MDRNITAFPLFRDCPRAELERFIETAPCRRCVYRKGSLLIRQGEKVEAAGLLLSGRVKAVHVSQNGEESIRSILSSGDIFGQILMASEKDESPVSVEALEETCVLFVPLKAVMRAGGKCGETLRTNLLHLVSARCWQLTRQVSVLSEKTLRARVAGYLLQQRNDAGSDTFRLPVNREELAQLLCVNRSALSRELAKMRTEGLLDFYRGSFRLRDIPGLASCCEHS